MYTIHLHDNLPNHVRFPNNVRAYEAMSHRQNLLRHTKSLNDLTQFRQRLLLKNICCVAIMLYCYRLTGVLRKLMSSSYLKQYFSFSYIFFLLFVTYLVQPTIFPIIAHKHFKLLTYSVICAFNSILYIIGCYHSFCSLVKTMLPEQHKSKRKICI